MYDISNPPTRRAETSCLRCARICAKATEHRIGSRLLLRLLLLRLLLTERSCSLAERCPVKVKNEKKHAIREIPHLQPGQIHPAGQKLIH